MEKIKEYKGIIILMLVVLAGAFYWLQLRPMIIKRDCSWFVYHPELSSSVNATSTRDLSSSIYADLIPTRVNRYQDLIPSKIEKEVIKEATISQYNACLRHNGL